MGWQTDKLTTRTCHWNATLSTRDNLTNDDEMERNGLRWRSGSKRFKLNPKLNRNRNRIQKLQMQLQLQQNRIRNRNRKKRHIGTCKFLWAAVDISQLQAHSCGRKNSTYSVLSECTEKALIFNVCSNTINSFNLVPTSLAAAVDVGTGKAAVAATANRYILRFWFRFRCGGHKVRPQQMDLTLSRRLCQQIHSAFSGRTSCPFVTDSDTDRGNIFRCTVYMYMHMCCVLVSFCSSALHLRLWPVLSAPFVFAHIFSKGLQTYIIPRPPRCNPTFSHLASEESKGSMKTAGRQVVENPFQVTFMGRHTLRVDVENNPDCLRF